MSGDVRSGYAMDEDNVQLFVTYAHSSIGGVSEFDRRFVEILERNGWLSVEYYGGCEVREDGVHYHVYLYLGQQGNWSWDGIREKLKLEGDAGASVHVFSRRLSEDAERFQGRMTGYIEKFEDRFGRRPTARRSGENMGTVDVLAVDGEYLRGFSSISAALRALGSGRDGVGGVE